MPDGSATETVAPDSFDVVLECSDSAPGAARYVQIGIFGNAVTVPFDQVLYKELTITSGLAATPTSWRHAMALIEQRLVTLAPLVTRQVPISDFAEALRAAQTGEGLKTVVVP